MTIEYKYAMAMRKIRRSPLHAELAARILGSLHDQGLGVGHHLVEQDLCQQLGVSRTPVRAALQLLAEQGCVKARPNRGFILVKPATDFLSVEPVDPREEEDRQLFVTIAEAHHAGKLPLQLTQQQIVRSFGARLPTVLRVLRRMTELGLVQRKPGVGWSFMAMIEAHRMRSESYGLRRAIEPAMLLQPAFELDRAWAQHIRMRHLKFLREPPRETSAMQFLEMNSNFHEQLARCSGNAYMLGAIQQQIRLHTFMSHRWAHATERVSTSINEHLVILDALQANRNQDAAMLMEGHLLASLMAGEMRVD